MEREYPFFKKAAFLSILIHVALFMIILVSPHFPKSSRKDLVHYVNVISFSGGGNGGGSSGGGQREEEKIVETAVPAKETLRDLTIPEKLKQESSASLRHPVEKPKRDKKPKTKKKSIIQKSSSNKTQSKKTIPSSNGNKKGTGIGIGVGDGSGSGEDFGFGSEYASQIGLSNFPFTYYLQWIHDRISSNWIISQISAGVRGNFHTTVKFKIFKNGEISNVEFIERSKIRSLDLSVLRAIQRAAPFPPLPREYEDEYLIIRLIFEHKK